MSEVCDHVNMSFDRHADRNTQWSLRMQGRRKSTFDGNERHADQYGDFEDEIEQGLAYIVQTVFATVG